MFRHQFPSTVHLNTILAATFPVFCINYIIIWFQIAWFTTVNTRVTKDSTVVIWGFHVSDARKVFPCQVFSDTLCFELFSFTVVSWREVPQMYWKLFSSYLSVFNSAALAFLCAYIKCSWLQSTQRSKIPTFKTVGLSSFWKWDIRSLLCGVD